MLSNLSIMDNKQVFHMIRITEAKSIPISINRETRTLVFDDAVKYDTSYSVPISEISPILLNKSLKYPETVYNQCMGVSRDVSVREGSVRCNLFHIPSGLLGIEFNRTHVYTSNEQRGKSACLVEVMEGELTIILQKDKQAEDFSFVKYVDEIKIVKLYEGDKCSIPSGYMFNFINSTESDVVFTVVAINLQKLDYGYLSKEKGLAVFIISKNSKSEVVLNPKYRVEEHPEVEPISNYKDSAKYTNKFTELSESFIDAINSYAQEMQSVLV